MKIGLVCPYNMLRGGGVQECVLALQHHLRKRGHVVSIITPQPRDYEAGPPEGMLFVGGSTNIKSIFRTTAQISVSVDTSALQDLLDTQQFDILHFHEPWVPILSRQILNRSNSVNIATFHAKLPGTVVSRTIERVVTPYTRSILKCIDVLTAVSDPAAEYVRTLTEAPVEIIPNGIDLDKYYKAPTKGAGSLAKLGSDYLRRSLFTAPNYKNSKPKTILYVGRLEGRKGLKYLLRAFALLQVKHPEVQLIIAGEGPDQPKLEKLTAELELKGVTFLGYIDEAEKIRLLRTSSLFCSPAIYGESFGIVLIEAMAAGLPIVAGDNPGYRAVLAERGRLSLVSPKDSDAFARQLEVMLFDIELRKLWRQWAGDYVTRFRYERIVDEYERVYEQAIYGKNTPA